MAFTALRTWVTGEIVTAGMLNEQIRDNGNMYIQKDGSIAFTADQPMGSFSLTGLAAGAAAGESVRYEQLYTISQADVTGSRTAGTVYRNTSGKIMAAVITGRNSIGANNTTTMSLAYCDENTPPTTVICGLTVQNATAVALDFDSHCSFLIPLLYYYKSRAHDSIIAWIEYTLN